MVRFDSLLAHDSSSTPGSTHSCPIVGVGGSAGGLEAFSELLGAFPATTGMAVVVVSHLDPAHSSMLTELLSRKTDLPVEVVSDGVLVEPDHVYVMPPNTTLRLAGRVLRLTPRADSPQPHLPIDIFFQSLAAVNGSAAIGIVLSGTGTDGTLGLCAIKAVEGTTLAQQPESAAYPHLPQSAISSGCVDLVLPPAALASAVAGLAESSRLALGGAAEQQPSLANEDLQSLFTLVQAAIEIDFSAYKPSMLLRRLQRRMVLHHCTTLEAYLQYLHEHPDEIRLLAHDFLIGVTEFFRDPEAFAALQQAVLIPLLQQRPLDAPVRVWVIGCATGQEAYSLAMLLIETAEAVGSSAPIQIFATDINDVALSVARAGIYSAASVQSLSPERRDRFLMPIKQGYRVTASLRERCIFARHNLLNDPPFSNLDLVSCRNMLIYLDRAQQQQIIPRLHYGLNAGGVLMLGASEQLLAFDDMFTPLDAVERLYVRTDMMQKVLLSASPYVYNRTLTLQGRVMSTDTERDRAMQQTAHRIMATHYAQPGVLITSGYDILHIYGHTGRYLEPAPGETSMNVLRMARDGLLAPIQQAVERATTQQTMARVEHVRLLSPGEARSVNLEVTPIRNPHVDGLLFLIVFLDVQLTERSGAAARHSEDTSAALAEEWREEMHALRAELAASKAYLRTIIAEQTATNDELKLLNEELLSRNEEVQSINEELQTAKEEVQSINEELITVNEELQQSNREVSAINSDLYRLLASINIPIVMLDRSGAIARFTPPAALLLGLQPSDLGHRLRGENIVVPTLDAIAADVQQRGQPTEVPFDNGDNQTYLLRIWPAHSVDGTIDGVALVWIDVGALKQAEQTRRRLELSLLEAQKLESLGVLAGGVAHDFNNLLAIMLGNAQLALLDLDPAAPAYTHIQQIESTSERAIDLTRQMLAYAGKGQRELEVVDLNMLVKSTDNLLRASIDKQITLRYALSTTPLWAHVDTTQIRQVLVNLVLNAAEAIGPTAPVVTIHSDQRWLDSMALVAFQVGGYAQPGTYIVLEVADNGVGMDAATVAKIFEPFFSTKFTGRGLGLAAISGIVQGHGGAIRVQSTPGQGTTMTVALPRAPHNALPKYANTEEQAPHPPVQLQQSSGGGTVLVIDDEHGIRRIATRMLAHLGFASITAADGAAGIALFEEQVQKVIFVLLDVTMPGLDTRQIVEALRAIRADIPILMMSGYPKDSVKDLFQTAGFLAKPFTLDQLRDALHIARIKSRHV